ncbi:gliding motility protein GldC [Saprospira sp. CCB-QB6]|uniref:gliding motility protein GldC n=1 Tax=Saprospira sp. CCB-QB6 TaxID=3023936 RepID=UPI00234B85D4|nr:gliding motility protein GldC [Saprospira sp. CCB-QB6]WCL82460.1 gliding motility protein GldC [Saprospira sp. CCB-QB6]
MGKDTKKVVQENNIQLTVGLNADRTPVKIEWEASDSQNGPEECKAMLISLFDKAHKDTLKIDLWTLDMQVNEMDRFMYQTLRGLADTYYRATNNQQLSNDFMRFVQYFGEKTETLPKK